MIDTIDSQSGLTHIYGKKLEDCLPEYPAAERMTIDEYCASKALAQDSPIEWEPTSRECYEEMLCVLPPAFYLSSGFLVGEPWDYHAMTGKPRYQCFRRVGGRYECSNRPLTVQEFKSALS